MVLNKHIEKTVFNDYNMFSMFKSSGYLTLVDEFGKPVVFKVNGKNIIFTFNKNHRYINIENKKNDFSFYEKLFIAGLFKKNYKWKNLNLNIFKKILSVALAIEPRNFYISIENGEPSFYFQ